MPKTKSKRFVTFGLSDDSNIQKYDSDPDDSCIDDSGLEMEDLMSSKTHPRRNSNKLKRGDHGHLLTRRTNNEEKNASSPPLSYASERVGPCNSNSRMIRLGRRAQRVLGNRNPCRSWVMFLLAIIVAFIFLNIFEGSSYLASINDTEVRDKGLKSDMPPVTDITNEVQGKYPSQAPQTATITPQPILSVDHHSINIENVNNSIATAWLDFDENDPPVRSTYPKTGKSDAFTKQWCDLRGTTWYPNSPNQIWQQRAPYFLLPGALYSGTVHVAAALHQHPSILPARTKELQFFHDRPFRRYVSIQEKTLVRAARERMYARDYDVSRLQRNTSYISFDASPGYLFYSTLIPRRILCVIPWVKLVLVLRNPIDRILEHYIAAQQRGLRLSLEEWIDQEFALLEQVGWNNVTVGSKEEDVAWYEYQSTTIGGALGRSLYVVQIRHWLQAMRAVGRNPATEILIVQTEKLASNPDHEYRRTLRFLHLPEISLPNAKSLPPITVTHQRHPTIQAATRQRLEDFFKVHNRRLKRLMRQYGISSSVEEDRFG